MAYTIGNKLHLDTRWSFKSFPPHFGLLGDLLGAPMCSRKTQHLVPIWWNHSWVCIRICSSNTVETLGLSFIYTYGSIDLSIKRPWCPLWNAKAWPKWHRDTMTILAVYSGYYTCAPKWWKDTWNWFILLLECETPCIKDRRRQVECHRPGCPCLAIVYHHPMLYWGQYESYEGSTLLVLRSIISFMRRFTIEWLGIELVRVHSLPVVLGSC